jgi:hypothetical protein
MLPIIADVGNDYPVPAVPVSASKAAKTDRIDAESVSCRQSPDVLPGKHALTG